MTNNERMVIFCYDELKKLIQEEVSQFSKVIETFMREHGQSKHKDEAPLSIQDVADRYGVSKQTVHNWMKEGKITGFKQGKGRYFYRHELEKKLTDYSHFRRLQETGELSKDITHMDFIRGNHY